MRAPRFSYLDRMVHVTNVGWSRMPSGAGYWVTWDEDGERKVLNFRSAASAEQFAEYLDTSGGAVSAKSMRDAELALRDLERTMERLDEEAAMEALEDLDRTMRSTWPSEPSRDIHVRPHRKRKGR